MSSHREAPEISKDPVADSTDLYAFVSPDRPDTVTLIANYVPLQDPAGGPNFFEFGDDVLYEIHVSNRGDAMSADVTYTFRVQHRGAQPGDLPLQHRADQGADGQDLQPAPVLHRLAHRPARHEGPRHAPRLRRRATSARARPRLPAPWRLPRCTPCRAGGSVFAGQRADAFHVDLGSVFDLLDLRPFQNLHLIPTAAAPGVNALANLNVHSIALQVPDHGRHRLGAARRTSSTRGPRSASGPPRAAAPPACYDGDDDRYTGHGPWRQVSRLGNPLVNEVLIPMGRKDAWNARAPRTDKHFVEYVRRPEVARLLPVLYPGVFPNLAKLDADRADLVAILLTGLPKGVVPGFQNYTGPTLRRHAAAEPGGPADGAGEGEPARHRGWRPRRLPQRAPGAGRRRHHRAAGDRRRDLSRWSRPSYTPDGAAGPRPGRDRSRAFARRRSRTWARRTTASAQRHERAAARPPAPPPATAGRGEERGGGAGPRARGRRRGARRAGPARAGRARECGDRAEPGARGRRRRRPRTHVAVLARPLGRGRVHAAVYPSLPAGRWRVHAPDDDRVVLTVDVPGTRVTQARWPAGAMPGDRADVPAA